MQPLVNKIKINLWNDRFFYLVTLFFFVAGIFAGLYSAANSEAVNQYILDLLSQGMGEKSWLACFFWLLWGHFCMTMLMIFAGYYALTFPICLGVLVYWGIRMALFLKTFIGMIGFFSILLLFLVYVGASLCYNKIGVESLKSSIHFFQLRNVAKTPREKLLFGKEFVKKCAIIFGILVLLSILECSIGRGMDGQVPVNTMILKSSHVFTAV